MENINEPVPQGGNPIPPTPPVTPSSSIPPAPSIPPAHQMMGSMPGMATASTTAAGASSFWSSFIAILILVLGGGSIYFAVTKTSTPSGTPVTEIPGFDLSNNQTQNENSGIAVGEPNPNGEPLDTGTTPTDGNSTPSTPPESTSVSKTHSFKCEDVLSIADYKKIIKYTGTVTVTPDELPGIYYKCEYQQTDENADWRTFQHSLGLNFEFPAVAPAAYYDLSRDTAIGSYAKTISPDSKLTNEDVVGVGAKAFIPSLFKGSLMGVLSTNQKYYFNLQIFPDADAVFIKELGKVVDANLNKY